jgi:PAS domain S-box-containing protein
VNDKFCVISGYTRQELLGQNHRIVKSGLHDATFYKDLWGTIVCGRVWQGEVCNRKKNGELYWVEATIFPILDRKGAPLQYISIRTDITALNATQEALRIGEERLRRGQQFANIGTWEWTIETGDLFWSERIAPLFGYPVGELATSYENFLNALHPDDRQSVIDAVAACVERDAPYEIEHRVVWPDGTVCWLLERGAVTRDKAGKALKMLGVVQDIDKRKKAELALVHSETKLANTNHMLHLVMDSIPARIFWKDMDLRYLGCNRAFAADVGRSDPREIIGLDDLSMPWSDWAELYRQDDRAVIASRQPKLDYEEGQTTADGHKLWLNTSKVPLFDAQAQLVGVLGVYADITERKLSEQALIAAREAADRANQAKSDFLSSMSHELRTPMNAILGFAQMLEYDSEMTADQQDNVHEILKAGRHLLDLINEVLDLAKIESGRIELSMEGVDLPTLGEDCRHLIQPLADQAGIDLRFELLAENSVFSDRVRLKQVLLNLLSNAIKYNRPGGSVRLTAAAGKPGYLRLAVTDTGTGIAPERLSDLFQPFNRLGAEASEIEGTGIGLTITRRLLDLMGGEVGVESTLGIGTTFWLELALGQTAKVGAGRTVADSINANESPQREAQVLAIDDNPANLKLIAQVMGMREHVHLLTAHTPELGIELALLHRPDLILLDINMPEMDGYQVLKVLQASAELRHIPVVAITANAMPREVERGKAAGFTDYLTKPLDIGHFLQVADALLDAATTLPPAQL